MSDDDLVRGFIADLEKRFGAPPIKCATFEIQNVPDALHADWDDVKNHVTIRLQKWGEFHRKGRQLAHESFHVFSPAKQGEATYLDEGLATLNAKDQNYSPHPDSEYHVALSLVEHLIPIPSESCLV